MWFVLRTNLTPPRHCFRCISQLQTLSDFQMIYQSIARPSHINLQEYESGLTKTLRNRVDCFQAIFKSLFIKKRSFHNFRLFLTLSYFEYTDAFA